MILRRYGLPSTLASLRSSFHKIEDKMKDADPAGREEKKKNAFWARK